MRPVLNAAPAGHAYALRRRALARDGVLPGQLHRAQARSYVMCAAITDDGHSHAFNTSAKQSNLRRLV